MHKINGYSHYANVLLESPAYTLSILRASAVSAQVCAGPLGRQTRTLMIVYDDRSPPVRVSIHGAELVNVVDSATLTKGLEQHTTRGLVHDDDVITGERMLRVGWHDRNVPFTPFTVPLDGDLDVRRRWWVSVRCVLHIRCHCGRV